VFADIARLVRAPDRVVPLVNRELIAHAQTFSTDRAGEVA
jgi:hypothetical protein